MCFSKKLIIKNSPQSSNLCNMITNDGIGKGLFDEFNCHCVELDNEYTYSDFNNKKNFNVIHLNVHSIREKSSQLIY